LKEDYDFTAQHLRTHGLVCRLNRLEVEAEHYTNGGGAVAYRDPMTEKKNIDRIMRKWPGAFTLNKTKNYDAETGTATEIRFSNPKKCLSTENQLPPPPPGSDSRWSNYSTYVHICGNNH